MELNQDWKCFQALFYSKKRLTQADPIQPIYLILDKKVIVSAFCEGEDLCDWIGATDDEMLSEFANRELIFFDRAKVDGWMYSSIGIGHFYDQIRFLCTEAKPYLSTRNRFKNYSMGVQRHFLLHALQSWWRKLLPGTYGILIRFEGSFQSATQPAPVFLVVQRGRLESFHVPDLSGMIPDRRRYANDVVKHLSENYLMPVQGLFLTQEEWNAWSDGDNPWPKVMSALKKNRNKLTPFSWSLTALIAIRAYFGV